MLRQTMTRHKILLSSPFYSIDLAKQTPLGLVETIYTEYIIYFSLASTKPVCLLYS